jgi:hypothetical protein
MNDPFSATSTGNDRLSPEVELLESSEIFVFDYHVIEDETVFFFFFFLFFIFFLFFFFIFLFLFYFFFFLFVIAYACRPARGSVSRHQPFP